MSKFQRGPGFPNEQFVQEAVKAHFIAQGFDIIVEGHKDVVAVHAESGNRWVVEAKGQTSDIGTDFNTCLGQILKRMTDDEVGRFGLAMPDTHKYASQIKQISNRVRRTLQLHWLIVREDGTVRVIEPGDPPPHSE